MHGHDIGFHDHDHSVAAIAVLRGAITEERLAMRGPVEHTLASGARHPRPADLPLEPAA